MNHVLLLLRPVVSALALGAWLPGQAPAPQPEVQNALRAIDVDPAAWRAPIHTQPDDPVFGAYGWWAVGRDYKVSFHDGFVFYPYLGPTYPENLPLRWTTTRVTAGGAPIADLRAAQHAHGDWRWEYRFGGVTEAYDVREDGVEHRPAAPGDLVIEGRVQTRLVPAWPVVAARHGELVFTDARGTPIICYGAATAIDALGARTPVTTSLDAGVVRTRDAVKHAPASSSRCATAWDERCDLHARPPSIVGGPSAGSGSTRERRCNGAGASPSR